MIIGSPHYCVDYTMKSCLPWIGPYCSRSCQDTGIKWIIFLIYCSHGNHSQISPPSLQKCFPVNFLLGKLLILMELYFTAIYIIWQHIIPSCFLMSFYLLVIFFFFFALALVLDLIVFYVDHQNQTVFTQEVLNYLLFGFLFLQILI